ncbi:nitrate reductase cytochrome c-type subunit [Candidatus Electrothrix sp.]|uniref:nitrate reductase cytochrome c-type subunit n=1 Tax=Candidatus Electrothrix sp. TaxID=2170559 RepID=UPI004055D3BD
MKWIIFPLFFIAAVCCFSFASAEDDIQSLRGSKDILADSAPAVDMDWQPTGSAVPRTSAHQPPLIPHDINGMKISKAMNMCLNCHGIEGIGVPKPFATHYTDRDGNTGEKISQRWYFCTQCHVGQVDAPPLVENTFK